MFTYLGTLATDLDKVRFAIRDTAYDAGPLPEDANFQDEEIAGLIAVEGSWQRAVAALYEALAMAWLKHPTFSADGVRVDQSAIAAGYRAQAEKLRREVGSGALLTSGTVAVTRIDGYSDDVANEETDD